MRNPYIFVPRDAIKVITGSFAASWRPVTLVAVGGLAGVVALRHGSSNETQRLTVVGSPPPFHARWRPCGRHKRVSYGTASIVVPAASTTLGPGSNPCTAALTPP